MRDFWLSAPEGRLSAWELAKALAFREASRELSGGEVNLAWVAARVTKVGGGHPTRSAMCQFFAMVDADPEWFPGKHSGAKRGRKPLLTPAKRRRIANAAMTGKKIRREEPCVAAVIRDEPVATMNPVTGKPFCDKTIRKVFLEDCYDFEPGSPWKFQSALQKVFLPDSLKQQRYDMAKYILQYGPTVAWWAQHVVWFDPCCSIIPGSQNHYDRMRQALKGNKRYISDDAKMYSPNLRGPSTALRQRTWEGRKINWVMMLARGKIHVQVIPENWTVNGEGLAAVVKMLPSVLRKMLGLGAHLPRNVFTDRGTGMYTSSGKIVEKYRQAIDEAGFSVYWGPDARRQSPDMGDMLLHETAVAWFRRRMRAERPVCVPWEETRVQWAHRAKRVLDHINSHYDVAGLCRQFPESLHAVTDSGVERLRT